MANSGMSVNSPKCSLRKPGVYNISLPKLCEFLLLRVQVRQSFCLGGVKVLKEMPELDYFKPLNQESPRQTKPNEGPKRKVHEFRPFL